MEHGWRRRSCNQALRREEGPHLTLCNQALMGKEALVLGGKPSRQMWARGSVWMQLMRIYIKYFGSLPTVDAWLAVLGIGRIHQIQIHQIQVGQLTHTRLILAGHCVANRIKARTKVYIFVPFWNWTKPFEWLNWSDMLYPSKIFWWSNIFRSSHGHGVFISWELCDVWKITASLMVFEGCDNWLYDGAAIIIEQTLLAGHHQGEEKIIQNQHSLLQWKLPPHQAMQVTVFWIISILKVLPQIYIAELCLLPLIFKQAPEAVYIDLRPTEVKSLRNQTTASQFIMLTVCDVLQELCSLWLWTLDKQERRGSRRMNHKVSKPLPRPTPTSNHTQSYNNV